MSKLTRKYGKKFTTFKAFTVATLAGIATVGMAQAQSPDVIMAPTPELSNLEFGTGDQSMTFETKEFYGVNNLFDSNTSNLWTDEVNYVEEQGWLGQDFVDSIKLKDTNVPSIKYNYTLDNFSDQMTTIDTPTSEITVDYVNEVQDIWIGSGVGIDMTIDY
ncbi:hypothetical protein IJ472_06025, partial [bacterium]|nr:hypothetical protein [bacterium]